MRDMEIIGLYIVFVFIATIVAGPAFVVALILAKDAEAVIYFFILFLIIFTLIGYGFLL